MAKISLSLPSRLTTPRDPYWNEAFSLMGTWEVITQKLDGAITVVPAMLGYRKCEFSVQLYQGEEARTYMDGAVKNELRYEEQKRAQPNN
jgi:hypothetical protein